MAGENEIVLKLEELIGISEEIRDALEGLEGNSAGGSGGASSGKAGKKSLSLKKGLKRFTSAVNAVDGLVTATGVSAGLRAANLGATNSQAVNTGLRAFAETVTNLPFGNFLAANTSETLQAQGRAQSSVSNIAEQVARAGGSVSRGGIREALKRQNEIEGRVQTARQAVAQEQADEGSEDLAKAAGKDFDNLFGALTSAVEQLTSVLETKSQTAGGVR